MQIFLSFNLISKRLLLATGFFLTVFPGFSQSDSLPSLEGYISKNNIPVRNGDDGLRYVLQAPGSGPSPKEGEYTLIKFKAMLLDSTVFDQSHDGEPFIFQVGNREVIKGLDRGVRLLKKGGKAVFYVPASLGYMQYGVGKTVPPNSPLMYEVELLDIMDYDRYDAFMRDFEEQERQEFERHKKQQFDTDLLLLSEYAAAQKLKVKRTSSGLSFLITKPGKGESAKPGKHLKVEYQGFLTDGTSFDQSASGKTYDFVLGLGRVLDGWDEGLQFFNQGAEGWLLLPSQLAYGPLEIKENNISIPANSALIFKIKVLEIR